MAFNSAGTDGDHTTIAANVNTLLGTLSIKAGTAPSIALTKIGSDKIIAVVVYEHA